MAHAIARMMESFGLTNSGWSGGAAALPGSVLPPGAPGWPSAFGGWPSGGSGASPMNRMADGVYREMAGAVSGSGPLDGVWEDNQGGLLIVQGGRYRLYSACNGFIDGDIRLASDRLELVNRQENITQIFEFALDQGRLALRNQSGQVFLYRRLVLDPSR